MTQFKLLRQLTKEERDALYKYAIDISNDIVKQALGAIMNDPAKEDPKPPPTGDVTTEQELRERLRMNDCGHHQVLEIGGDDYQYHEWCSRCGALRKICRFETSTWQLPKDKR